MLAQDPYSGALYDVPEMSGYGEVPFDGLGFSLPGILGGLLPGIGNLFGGLFGGGQGGGGQRQTPFPIPQLPFPLPGLPQQLQSLIPNFNNFFPRPPPPPPFVPGWTMPAPWVNRRAPRNVYMRCGVWPGQPGLVPVNQFPGNGAPVPAVPVVPAVPYAGGRRPHHRRRYR